MVAVQSLNYSFRASWRALKNKIESFAEHQHAVKLLWLLSFLEAFISPISPMLLLVPMCFYQQRRAHHLIWQATVAATVGALMGYAIGCWVYELALPLFAKLGYAEGLAKANGWVKEWGVLMLFVSSIFPIPFKLFTVAAGAAKLNLVVFTATTVLVRWLHFLLGLCLVLIYNAAFTTSNGNRS